MSDRPESPAAQHRDPRDQRTSEAGLLPDTQEGRHEGPGTSAAYPSGHTTNQWLIERGQPEGEQNAVWLEHTGIHPATEGRWTRNAWDAAMFPDKATAEAYIAERGLEARAVEHGFMHEPTREEKLTAAVEGLLSVGERSRSGDPTLDPEEWYAIRDYARKVLSDD